MTEYKIDIEDAIDLLERLKRENYTVTIQALEMAIEALAQNEKLKTVIKGWCRQGAVAEDINEVSCKHCTRRIDGKCPLDNSEECPQSDEEAIELFFKYGLGCEL